MTAVAIPAAANHAVAGMSFDADRLLARRNTLGASEIPAVVGLNPHRSALDVYLEKRGEVESFSGNEFTEWGLRLENVVAEKYADVMGVMLQTSETLTASDEPWMSATPDRFVFPEIASGPTHGLEIKNKSARQIVHWGESGTDAVPHDIAVQCHWSMLVTGYRTWDIAVLFGGNTFRWYRLDYDISIASTLIDRGRRFWHDNVLAGVPPEIDGSKAAGEYLKKRFAMHTDVVREATKEEVPLIASLAATREKITLLEEQEASTMNRLKAAIGDAAGITSRIGRVTWKAPAPTRKVDYPAMAAHLLRFATDVERNEVTDAFTSEKANSRRFLLSIPKD